MARVRLYEPASIFEAYTLNGILEQCGIDGQVHGDTLLGGIGELPVGNMLFISVPEMQYEEACAVVKDYEKNQYAVNDTDDHDENNFKA